MELKIQNIERKKESKKKKKKWKEMKIEAKPKVWKLYKS